MKHGYINRKAVVSIVILDRCGLIKTLLPLTGINISHQFFKNINT